MDLIITFEANRTEPTSSRLVLSVGDTALRSYPMSADDQYRDLFALRNLLVRRSPMSIMIGNEPLGAVDFSLERDDIVTLKPYNSSEGHLNSKEFYLSQGLRSIDTALVAISYQLSSDIAYLKSEALNDIKEGLYDNPIV